MNVEETITQLKERQDKTIQFISSLRSENSEIANQIIKLENSLVQLKEEVENLNTGYKTSTQLDKLASALAKAQCEIQPAKSDMINTHYNSKYSSLTALKLASTSILGKNGLVYIERINKNIIIGTLLHSSGQFMTSSMKIDPIRKDIQSLSAYITYCRRIMYSCLTGTVGEKEIDDDGNNEKINLEK